jgi:hypothetical protein
MMLLLSYNTGYGSDLWLAVRCCGLYGGSAQMRLAMTEECLR